MAEKEMLGAGLGNEPLPWEEPIDPKDLPNMDQPAEVTIKFGKGLMEDPFTSKAGKELVEVKIPNRDPSDKSPWESFVVPRNFIHDNKFGKGVWMKLPEDGTTKVSRSVITGQDENGRNVWKRETRTVTNTELKSMMEAYKERSKDSVLGDLSGKKAQTAEKGKSSRPPARKNAQPAL